MITSIKILHDYYRTVSSYPCDSDHRKNMESEEVFQEQLTIHLSREFSNLLGQCGI